MNQKIHIPGLTTSGALKTRSTDQRYPHLQLKHIVILLLSILAIPTYGQEKFRYLYADKPIELKGTEYVFSRFEYGGKMSSARERYLLFINTRNGQSKRIDFANKGRIQSTQQIKIDSLQINKVLMAIHSERADDKHFDWVYPNQLILLSIDGEETVTLTEDRFFVRNWEINYMTGNIVVTGYYDVNDNGKHDTADEYEMLLYDLKTAKLISRINL